jgi:hypothetical protein
MFDPPYDTSKNEIPMAELMIQTTIMTCYVGTYLDEPGGKAIMSGSLSASY